MSRIKITSVGQPVGSNTRLRHVDMDHASTLVEYCGRGYHLGVSSPDTPAWYLSCTAYTAEGDWLIRAYYHNEDARLVDNDPPDWIMKLVRLVDSIRPPTVNLHPPYAIRSTHHG